MMTMALVAIVAVPARAQLEGAADPSRVDRRVREAQTPPKVVAVPLQRESGRTQTAPAGSEQVHLVLHKVEISGATRYSAEELQPLFAEFLERDITLNQLWAIAARVSEHYQRNGYFLSRAYVPQQEIADGVVRLKVVEGYIGELELDAQARTNRQVGYWASRILNKSPLNIAELESLLLRLNDLAGQDFRAVLELPRDPHAAEGAARLNIVTVEEKGLGRFTLDNYGSVFLGPWEMSQQLNLSFLPGQKTSLTLLTTAQGKELRYGSIGHEIPLSYNWLLDASLSQTRAYPGDELAVQDINNISRNYGLGLTYRPIRQRDENLLFRVALDVRDVRSRIFSTFPLTEDHLRVVRGSASYQMAEEAGAYNLVSATLSRGLSGFGASGKGDLNVSRAEATPDFTKLELQLTRLQPLPYALTLVGSVAGQWASTPLYSSEEFGYGGQPFGRAYDNSELTGDMGIAASLELRYSGLPGYRTISATPYVFIDRGQVWNRDSGQGDPLVASSVGAGVRVVAGGNLSGDFNIAYPLLRDIGVPLDGDPQGPRISFSFAYDF